MLTKLTLTIDQDVVIKTKNYAQKKHRSVSKLVEDYLKTVSDADSNKSENNMDVAPLTNSITGMFKEEYKGQSYKDILETALPERNS